MGLHNRKTHDRIRTEEMKMTKIDPNADILGFDGKKLKGPPLLVADQFCALAMLDRSQVATYTPREAYLLNGLMQTIASAKKPISLTDIEVKLLKRMLENALAAKAGVSTFLVGSLYEILDSKGDGKKDSKGDGK